EDGIRDFHVTGVQTCALPISVRSGAVCRPDDVRLAAVCRLLALFGGAGGLGRAGDLPAAGAPAAVVATAMQPGAAGSRPAGVIEIGRASCRERGWIAVLAG